MFLLSEEEEYQIIFEGYLKQLSYGIENIKSGQNIYTILKNHKNTAYLKMIDKTNKKEDLIYLRKDTYMGISEFKRLKSRYLDVKKNENSKYKNNKIIKNMIKMNITDKDIDLTVKWYEDEVRPILNKKIKECN